MAEDTKPKDLSERSTGIMQVAGDTAILSNHLPSLISRFRSLLNYSSNNYLFANMDKTKYLLLSSNPISDPLPIEEDKMIESCGKDRYKYLGITVIQSKSLYDHIMENINQKKGNLVKYHHWLDNNKYVPFKIKLHVLYSCVLPAIFYGAETWWELDKVKDVILDIERSALKKMSLRQKKRTN